MTEHKVRVLEHAVELHSLAIVIMQVVVIGGSILDFTAKVRSPQVEVSPCTKKVISTCSSHARHMLITCSSHAHHMLVTCMSHAHHMHVTCSSHACHMLIT